MKKFIIAGIISFIVGFGASFVCGESRGFPANIKLDTSAVYVASGDTAFTKKFQFAGSAYKIGKIAIFDTNIVSQDTINIGNGVKVFQRICFPTGNMFGFATTDTLCDKCGDSTSTAFLNSEGISSDSLIVATIDTNQMVKAALGDGQETTTWISKGYFVPITDPAPFVDYMIIGGSTLGATKKKVVIAIWSFRGTPISKLR